MSATAALLDPVTLAAINRPVAEAVGLPRHAYTDPAFLALERAHVFDASWTFICAAERLPNPGDLMPLDLIGRPIVIARQRDGGIKAFHNVCRHRGVILVEAPQSSRPTMICPYHAWSYGLDGRLLKTPHFSGDGNHDHSMIERECLDLKAIRCETWNGLVFVNMSGDAVPLATHMAPVAARYADFDFSEMRLGRVMEFEVAANWKLPIENFIEGYHLPWTHPFLNSVSSMANHYSVLDEPIVGQGSLLYERDKAGHPDLPTFSGLSQHWAVRAEYPSLLPNMLLGVHIDHISVWGMFPSASIACWNGSASSTPARPRWRTSSPGCARSRSKTCTTSTWKISGSWRRCSAVGHRPATSILASRHTTSAACTRSRGESPMQWASVSACARPNHERSSE